VGESDWRWTNGDVLQVPPYSPWAFGSTPIGAERDAFDCMEMELEPEDTIGRWSDRSCDEVTPFICEDAPLATNEECTVLETATKVFTICAAPLSYLEASARCEELGGQLARIDSADENAALSEAAAALALDAYLGGTDADDEGLWVWPDGSVFDDLR
jgi:hypothetical protein